MNNKRTKFEKAVYHAQLVIASSKSPTTTKKGTGRKHVSGCSKQVKEHAFAANSNVKQYGYDK